MLIVTPDESTGGYMALEGNRRIAALEAMMTPALASSTAIHSQFQGLHKKFPGSGITSVECFCLDRSKAGKWIRRRHYKGMGGAGVLPWNAVATARSDASEGRYARWLTALSFIEQDGVDAEIMRDSIASKTTSVERCSLRAICQGFRD